jgi:hypothetical protein
MAETVQNVPSKGKILTEKEFDFSDAGFASELFRVGGRDMRREYETRVHSTNLSPSIRMLQT